jgi:hypothetical protein
MRTRFGIVMVGTVATVAACGPLFVQTTGAPSSSAPSSAAPSAAAASLQARFKTGALQIGTGEHRALATLLGALTGLAPGSTTVTVLSNTNPGLVAQLSLNVVANKSAVQIVLTPATAILQPGDSQPLLAAVHLADGTVNANVNWSSSDGTIATVNPTTGVVTALKEGRVTIKATYAPDATFNQVAEIQVVKDRNVTPSALPSVVVFGSVASPTPTPPPGPSPTPGPIGKWVAQQSGAQENLRSVRFLNATTGFAMGDKGVVVTTTNGGTTWKATYPLTLGFQDIFQADWVSPSVGFALARDGKLYRTTNGGADWKTVDLNPVHGYLSLRCIGSKAFVITVPDIYESDDSGTSWVKLDLVLPADQAAQTIATFGTKTFVAVGRKLYSKIAGVGWVPTALPGGGTRLQFFSETLGYSFGAILPNGAGTGLWRVGEADSVYINVPGRPVSDVIFTDAMQAFALAVPLDATFRDAKGNLFVTPVISTSNGGATWQPVPFTGLVPTFEELNAIDFPTGADGWLVGNMGKIFHFVPAPAAP